MDVKVLSGLAGGLAGAIRVLKGLGWKKATGDKKAKKEPINWKMAGASIVQGLVLGIAAGAAFEDPITAFMTTLGISSVADINKFIKL